MNMEKIFNIIQQKKNWTRLMTNGLSEYIEYLDPCEIENCLISMKLDKSINKNYSHTEIKPTLVIGSFSILYPIF